MNPGLARVVALLAAFCVGGCEFGPGAPQLPPQAAPDDAFNPVFDCAGVAPNPRFAKRCQIFRTR